MKSFVKWLDQNRWMRGSLMLLDLVGLSAAFAMAYWIRNDLLGPPIQPFEVYAQALPAVFVILLVTFYGFGLYERGGRLTTLHEQSQLIRAITLVWVLVMAASFLQKYDYSRGLVLLLYGFALGFIGVGRWVHRWVHRRLQRKGWFVTRVIVVGAGKPGKRVIEALKAYDAFGYKIVGVMDEDAEDPKADLPLLGKLKDLPQMIQVHRVDEVIIADPRLGHERILEAIHECANLSVKFKVVSDLFEIITGQIDVSEVDGLPSLNLRRSHPDWVYRGVKRLIDLVMAGVGLVFLLPVGVVLVALIRMESSGPAIFRQVRVGQNGKQFTLYKFRTMRVDANPNAHAPRDRNDRRVTRMGRWLRRTSLDELPQLWNVLKGDMSLVGPRPEMPFIVETYKPWQRRRLEAKPGLTGLWQILGRKDLPLHENLEYDFYYIQNQSLLLDLIIVVRTVSVLFGGKGAY